MTYWVERKLEFKTVQPRWEIEAMYDDAAPAEIRAAQGRWLLEQDKRLGIPTRSKGGGTIVEYRVRFG